MDLSKIWLLLIVSWPQIYCDYKLLTDYQDTLYQLILDHVDANKTTSSGAVLKFIYSDDTHVVFNDASASGYSRREVIMGTYQGSFLNHPNKVIIQALHDAVLQENMAHDASYYGSFVALGVGGLIMIVLSRYFWTYFRHDRRALNFYRANHHNYMLKGSDQRNTLTNTNNTNAPLLVPEPFF